MEQHTDLATGVRFRRQLLGGCLFGRPFLRPNTRSDRCSGSRVLLPSPARAGNAALGDHRYILCLTIPSKTPADRVFARTVAGPNHTVILGVVDNPFNHRREVLFLI